MQCLRKLPVLIALLMAPAGAVAGVETPLLIEIQGECTVRVVHDATPDSTIGTLVFRSYRLVDGLSFPCDLTPAQASASLSRGVAAYKAQPELKPVGSVFVGRIERYPWVRSSWQAESLAQSREQLDIEAFNRLVGSAEIGGPFNDALRVNDLEPNGASCEKQMYYDNGAPMDGMCWILIQPH